MACAFFSHSTIEDAEPQGGCEWDSRIWMCRVRTKNQVHAAPKVLQGPQIKAGSAETARRDTLAHRCKPLAHEQTDFSIFRAAHWLFKEPRIAGGLHGLQQLWNGSNGLVGGAWCMGRWVDLWREAKKEVLVERGKNSSIAIEFQSEFC